MPKVKEWYDGYLFGRQDIYNPWSILNFIQKAWSNVEGAIDTYWANSSGNDLLLKLFDCSLDGSSSRNDIERLLEGEPVNHVIDENINYSILRLNREAVWNILFFTGYLKATENPDVEHNGNAVPLMLVNKEIQLILKKKITEWYDRLPETGLVPCNTLIFA